MPIRHLPAPQERATTGLEPRLFGVIATQEACRDIAWFRVTDPPGQQPELERVPKLTGSGRRILVVDDNEDAADTLSDLLRILGFDVKTAYDGNAAINALGPFSPHAILLDLGMPDMDGYEVARKVREQSGCDVLLVAITGWGQSEDFRQSRAAGFNHHLVKPVDVTSLEQVLSPLLRRAEPAPA